LLVLLVLAGPASAQLFAGAASADVTPPLGAFIAGDARNRRFTAVHDPLRARAVALRGEDETVIVLTIDNLGVTHPDLLRIRAAAADDLAALGFDAAHLVLSSTHTHSGPDVVGLWGPDETTSGRDPAYVDHLIAAAAGAAVEAARSVRPVRLRAASAAVPLPWVLNVTEPGLLDPQLATLVLEDESGTVVATLTNYACHPTVRDAVADDVSADWIAGFYAAMTRALPGEHLFLQGAIGGWVQPDKGDRSHTLAARYGETVAEATLTLLEDAPVIPDADRVRFRSATLALPLDNPGWAALLDAGLLERPRRNGALETELAWFTLGAVQFATHPGETSPAHAVATRDLMDGSVEFVLGLAQDALGYVLTPHYWMRDDLPSAEYLRATSLGPRTGTLMMAGMAELVPGARAQREVGRAP
ncbi:MAG: hypothetical protein V2J02_21695, partial [Pseudomonadales bacterium]|nr:hypothetical protein [Pseudomonadales bacterium]